MKCPKVVLAYFHKLSRIAYQKSLLRLYINSLILWKWYYLCIITKLTCYPNRVIIWLYVAWIIVKIKHDIDQSNYDSMDALKMKGSIRIINLIQ
jgi:hypothetical protein